MKSYIFLLFCFGFLVTGCIKPETYDDVPKITNVTVSSNYVQSLETFFVTIYFEDGDGDLGEKDINSKENCFLYDERPNIVEINADTLAYNIPFIEENGSIEDIKGSIEIKVNTCCAHVIAPCIQPAEYPDTDTVVYRIKIVDRAGNESNETEEFYSPPIIVVCVE